MHNIHPLPCNLLSLAAQWRALGLLTVAFARQILQMAPSDPRRALQKAELLEMWAQTALAALSQQLAYSDAQSPPRDEADAQARAHLQAIMTALLILALFAQRLKRRLADSQRETFRQRPALTYAWATQSTPGYGAPVSFNDSG